MTDLAALVQDLTINDIDESNFSTEELALKSQWDTLTPSANEFLPQLNDSLRSKTYLVGSKPSQADVNVFKVVFPLASLWTSIDDLARNRHIIRWVDLIQNTLVNVPDNAKLHIDYSVKLPREFKKKKKDEAAKKDKIEKQKANASAIKEQKLKDKASGQSDEQKKAAKAAKEAKKAAKAKAKAEAEAKAKAAEVPPNPAQVDFRVGFIEKAVKHPNADSLYVSTIHMGDAEGPRTVLNLPPWFYVLPMMTMERLSLSTHHQVPKPVIRFSSKDLMVLLKRF
ncbi:unnamed protein product [Ambrosiozyma monospora]|uniref:Unnamed protein product n=1 Tax=Ambrosiozyma monospora TaxID=43982 RepID=A0ACB5T9K7_AMBMO|nr:unnamed protein product [Ambrosiozyma monospora]